VSQVANDLQFSLREGHHLNEPKSREAFFRRLRDSYRRAKSNITKVRCHNTFVFRPSAQEILATVLKGRLARTQQQIAKLKDEVAEAKEKLRKVRADGRGYPTSCGQ